jgi:dynein heavy chain
MERSLIELRKGLNGQLNMSEGMEDLAESLRLNIVPGRNPFHQCSWERLAWSSRKGIGSWFSDVLGRVGQLRDWTKALSMPSPMWLPGLFNPTAFLTAVMQVTARRNSLPLDNMTVETHVTAMMTPGEVTETGQVPADGAFIHGLFIEGARWALADDDDDDDDDDNNDGEDDYNNDGDAEPVAVKVEDTKKPEIYRANVSGVDCAGMLSDSKLKELMPAMPVMYVKAVVVEPSWEPTAVGYLRPETDIYNCPVYVTTFRGPTFVFLASLKTSDAVSKWVLAGVSLVMQTDN